MKYLIFAFLLISCKKEINEVSVATYELKATVSLKPTDKTLYYDIFVANSMETPINLWIWVKRLQKNDIKPYPVFFLFDAPTVCWVTIDAHKPVYGCSRETVEGNIMLPLDFNSVVVGKF